MPVNLNPAAGVTATPVVPYDSLGNLQQSVPGPNAGFSYLGSASFRDAQVTAQVSGSVTTPARGLMLALRMA